MAFLLTFYVGLTLAYRDAIPLFEAPDEASHLHYAAFVYENGRLPHQNPLEVPGEGMQAPLVYVIAAPLLGRSGLDTAWAARLGCATFPFYLRRSCERAAWRSKLRSRLPEFVSDGSPALRALRTTSSRPPP